MNNQKITEIILKEIIQAAESAFGIKLEVDLPLETPPNPEWGDFAVPVFLLAKDLKESPVVIAQKLAKTIRASDNISLAEANGPYVNLRLTANFFKEAVSEKKIVLEENKKEKVMVEYLSPNTNKPLHLGHMRNGFLGSSVSNILECVGNNVVKAMLVNDRGIHICKSMLAWQKFGNGETPESSGLKGDHLVGKYYVRFAEEVKRSPELMDEAKEMLQKWEVGDKEVIALWRKMNEWVYAGFEETFQKAGFEFDVRIYESQIYKQGKEIVEMGLKKGVFKKDEKGAIIFELPEADFGLNEDGSTRKVTVLRADGTSVYMTQDLALAVEKAEKYNLTKSVYVIGNEQDDYLRRLFAILKALGYQWADKCYHLSCAMVELTTGKMKSREGTVVDADDLIKEVEDLAKREIKKRIVGKRLTEQEINNRATKIGLAAIKFFLIKASPKQRIIFDPQESISFDGVTGPYCQYVYARANSTLKKANDLMINKNQVDFSLLGEKMEERVLAQKLLLFEESLHEAAQEYNPSIVANAVYDLARTFNQWYNSCRIADKENVELSNARLALVKTTMGKIKMGLGLLGIEALEEM